MKSGSRRGLGDDDDVVRTSRLLMRRARPDDLEAIHRIMSDPEVMAFWSTAPHASLEETRAWFDAMLAFDPRESDEFVLDLDGEVIGKVGGWRMPEIGLYLRRDRWGAGYAREALSAFAKRAAARGVPHLVADVDPRNERCLRLLGKVGFIETGRASATFTIDGRACDSVYLRLDLRDVAPAPPTA